jgi:hypothetical protein
MKFNNTVFIYLVFLENFLKKKPLGLSGLKDFYGTYFFKKEANSEKLILSITSLYLSLVSEMD